MRRFWIFIFLLIVPLTGCQTASSSKVTVEPADFSHKDELVSRDGFAALADRRIFTVMAFLNAVGFDEEANGQQMHPVRVRVRQLVSEAAAKHPRKLERWKQYYRVRPAGTFVYQDYALSLSADYPFRRIRPDEEIGYKLNLPGFSGFPAVLNDFWRTVGLEEIWNDVKPAYVKEINKYDIDGMNREMTFLWRYLRMPRKDNNVIVEVPDLLDTHYHAIGAGYENYIYNVESPGSYSYRLNIHEYLHSIVNEIVQKNYAAYADKIKGYYEAGENKPFVKSYHSLEVFTSECMVRAIDWRLRMHLADDFKAQQKASQARVEYLSSEGLTLTEPFFSLLGDYEKSIMPFEEFVPVMFEKLPPYEEQPD